MSENCQVIGHAASGTANDAIFVEALTQSTEPSPKFLYIQPMDMNPSSHNSSEPHPYFPSGDWEGFCNDPRGGGKKGDMTMTLEFAGGRITGAGSDPVGAYTWTGSYDTKAGTCSIKKTYPGRHSVQYKGNADENGIWGNWSIWIILARGDFHIWPKRKGAGDKGEEEKEEAAVKEGKWSLFDQNN